MTNFQMLSMTLRDTLRELLSERPSMQAVRTDQFMLSLLEHDTSTTVQALNELGVTKETFAAALKKVDRPGYKVVKPS